MKAQAEAAGPSSPAAAKVVALLAGLWEQYPLAKDVVERLESAVASGQDGTIARLLGPDGVTLADGSTVKLGRAVQLATQSGNEGTVQLLRKVVEVEDAESGTVRVRRDVEALDEMELDTRSTRTVRVQKGDPAPPARSPQAQAPQNGANQP